MEEDSIVKTSKAKGEVNNRVKDGYVQLAEKMEQVRNQVAKIERKYDELYQTVKEKEHSRNLSVALSDLESPEESRSTIENVTESTNTSSKQSIASEEPFLSTPEKPPEESPPSKLASDMDLEKMEDNPFL